MPTRSLVALLQNLGNSYLAVNRIADAIEAFERSLAAARRLWTEPHELTASAMYRLARIQHRLDNLGAALELHQQALEMRRAVLPAAHQDIASSLTEIAWVHKHEGRLEEALPFFEEAHAMDVELAGSTLSRNALESASNLAGVYVQLGKYDEAEELLEPTVRHLETLDPKPKRFYGITQLRRGMTLASLDRERDAIAAFEAAHAALLETTRPNDPALEAATRELAALYEKFGRAEEAARLRRR